MAGEVSKNLHLPLLDYLLLSQHVLAIALSACIMHAGMGYNLAIRWVMLINTFCINKTCTRTEKHILLDTVEKI